MKRTTIFLGILILFLQGTSLFATDIRGQIVKYNAYYKTYEPLLNIKIDLYQNNQHIKTTYTNAKGFYYIYNIKPNSYTLHIKQKSYNIDVHAIDKAQQQFQEINRFIL